MLHRRLALYVQEDIYDTFVAKSVAAAKKRVIGDPFAATTQAGPQIDVEQFDKIMDLIESGKKQGAKLQCGGGRVGKTGFFVENTVFSDVGDDMRIAREEIFGPVMQIMKFKTIDEVLKRANDTTYGLAAAVFTNNIETYLKYTERIQAGVVWVNSYHSNALQAPFGGFKQSGIGREFAEYGLAAYTEVKTVYVRNHNKIS